ncbi:hypothetical protein MXB_3783 [Myxobolus squamalis]|nr:hypothetical protein MXB_3783 [Myxobolus squamalis]
MIKSQIDLAIVFENTVSITDDQFDAIKTIIAYLIKVSGISTYGSRVSLVSFGDSYQIHSDLNSQSGISLGTALTLLYSIKKSSDTRVCAEKGLEAVSDRIFTENSKKERIPRIMIFIGAHASDCQGVEYIRSYATKLKERNIYSMSIGYGSLASEHELNIISWQTGYFWQIYKASQIYSVIYLMTTTITDTASAYLKNEAMIEPDSVDLGIIITDTATISAVDFKKYIATIISTISQINIKITASRISVMINSKYPKLLWNFSEKEATSVEYAKLYLSQYRKVTTETVSCLDTTLEKAKFELFNKEYQRVGVHRILILITTESSLCSEQSVFRADVEALKRDGIYIIVLSIGATVDEYLLKSVATSNKFYFYYSSITIFRIRITSLIKISTNPCPYLLKTLTPQKM